MRAAVLAVSAAAFAGGCPSPAARPCNDTAQCAPGEICLAGADGARTCRTAPPVADAGPGDAGPAGDDAGASDAGLLGDAGFVVDGGPTLRTLRGAVDVGAGTMRGATRALRGHLVGNGPDVERGTTYTLHQVQP